MANHVMRLVQDGGMVLAKCEGPDRDRTLAQITHYAHLYADEGPVAAQERTGKRYRTLWIAAKPSQLGERG